VGKVSKLEELIAKYCPDGVEYKVLSDICYITRGRVMSKAYLQNHAGEYPVYSSQTANNGIFGFIDNYDYDCESITWTTDGANAGSVFYHVNEKFSITNVCGLIPLPPLPVQREIVRILDNFTELTEELTKELTARKKQYEYYRDKLLTFGDEVPVVRLGDIGTIIRGSGLKKSDFTDNGIRCIHYGQIYTYYGTFTYDTKSFVSPELAAKLKKVNSGDIIIAVTSENIEDVCKCVAWLGEDDIVTGGHTAILKHNQNPKFIAYYLQTSSFFKQKCKIAHGTKVIEVAPKELEKILIPLPPLEEQERIVAILDRFDTLCNDLTSGLPAEIEARRKQYEYYRDKLLSFPKRSADKKVTA
jgi:type I restriction enzyme, S subunit